MSAYANPLRQNFSEARASADWPSLSTLTKKYNLCPARRLGKLLNVKCQIDQSGKIEQTNKNSILCLSNDFWDTVVIKAKTKRQVKEIFRRNGQIRNFVLFTFSAGLAILLRRNLKIGKVMIDQEYSGKEAVIKSIILDILHQEKRVPDIHFGHIGKESRAHYRAALIGLGRANPQKVIEFEELLKEIKKTEVGKRLKDA